jgi:cytochrome d ubiquinol oxidase subunit II
MGKTVTRQAGAWLANYRKLPLTLLLPALVYLGSLGCVAFSGMGRTATAFIASSLAMAGVIGTAGASMFPFVLPSSSVPAASLTVWDGVSSRLTLAIMLVVVVIFVPLTIFYTSWAYRVMSGKVTAKYIHDNEHGAY